MITLEFAKTFADEWIAAWNSHDLDKIMSHYVEDFEMTSPFIVKMTNELSGAIKGRENVRRYWAQALEKIPDLSFELIEVLASINTIVIYYKAVFGKQAAEVLFFDEYGKVKKGIAHYNEI
jgi:ketosteroid isomerase-like protein